LPVWHEPLAFVVDDAPAVAARQVVALLADAARLDAFAAAGRRFAVERVRPASVAHRLSAVYEQAVSHARR
jgi:hypothetical protein